MKYGYEENDAIDDDGGGGSGDAHEPVSQPNSNQEQYNKLSLSFLAILL